MCSDWFHSWSEQALVSVGKRMLSSNLLSQISNLAVANKSAFNYASNSSSIAQTPAGNSYVSTANNYHAYPINSPSNMVNLPSNAATGTKSPTNKITANNFEDVIKSIENFIPSVFVAINKLCVEYAIQEGRKVYTTPKSYLEMIQVSKFVILAKNIMNFDSLL